MGCSASSMPKTDLVYSWNGKALSLAVGKPEYLVSLFAEIRAVGFMMGFLKFKIRNLESLRLRRLSDPQCLPAPPLAVLHPLHLDRSLLGADGDVR